MEMMIQDVTTRFSQSCLAQVRFNSKGSEENGDRLKVYEVKDRKEVGEESSSPRRTLEINKAPKHVLIL